MKRWSAFPYIVSAAGGIKSEALPSQKTRSMYLRFFTSKKIGVPLCDALIPISLKCVHFKELFQPVCEVV